MNFKKTFLIGAVVGALLAVILWPGASYNGFLFNSMTTPEGSLISAWLCPFSVLMFFMRSMAAIVTIAIIGNAILYGLFAMLCFLLYKAIQRIGRGPKRRTQNLENRI